MTDLIIGASDTFTWEQLAPWAKSIRETDYKGDVALILYRGDQRIIDECIKLDIQVLTPDWGPFNQKIDHNKDGLPTQAHKMRNFHMWQYLQEQEQRYEEGIIFVTDTRDVYFQSDPTLFLPYMGWNRDIIGLPTENVRYKNEQWNRDIFIKCFGELVYHHLRMAERYTCNSGTFFGAYRYMKPTLLDMYQIAQNFPYTGVDQPTLNYLATHTTNHMVYVEHDLGYACQCGTTLDPSKSFLFDVQETPRPVINSDGRVTTARGVEYSLVHQWDRVPELTSIVRERYL